MRASIAIFFAALLWTCGVSDQAKERTGLGGKQYGGVFNANESEELRGLFPLSLTQASSHRIASQVYEGMVRFDQRDLSIQPGLAESWTVDESGTVYTFKIRLGVRFHDDPAFSGGKGRELSAVDIVHCLTALCTFSEENQMFWLFQDRVVGANAHYAASAKGQATTGVEGIELVDAHTVRIKLLNPWQSFLQILAHQGCWIWPKEIREYYGPDVAWHPVGTGPFRLKAYRRGEALILERDPRYWRVDADGNGLPFLDAIRFTFLQDKAMELQAFEKGQLSMVYELPVGRSDVLTTALSAGVQVQNIPGLSVQFYGFNQNLDPFKDVRVRRAFSMAIDRQFLVDSVLNGLAVPATRGVVPPGFKNYPYDSVPAQVFDPEQARALLAEAGFLDGADLPTVYLQVNNSGYGYVEVASEVQNMLATNLGARVVTSVLPSAQHFGRVERGEAALWREGWVADHPDPENFLALFYGKNAPLDNSSPASLNTTRYINARFDSLYLLALRTNDSNARMQILAKAESQVMQDAIVAPLYYERTVRLLQKWVMDLPVNGMEYRDLALVWFDNSMRPAH